MVYADIAHPRWILLFCAGNSSSEIQVIVICLPSTIDPCLILRLECSVLKITLIIYYASFRHCKMSCMFLMEWYRARSEVFFFFTGKQHNDSVGTHFILLYLYYRYKIHHWRMFISKPYFGENIDGLCRHTLDADACGLVNAIATKLDA